MGVIKQKAPQKKDLNLPVCGGCEKCGDLHPDHLYALGYDNKYYCKECFHRMAVKWPKPEPYKEPYKGPVARTVKLDDTMVALALKYAVGAELGGKSQVRADGDRKAMLSADQKVGQVTTLAYHLLRYGHAERYIASREAANANPWKGDGGSDDPGEAVDVKGSLMRAGEDWRRYRLPVRPRERHADNVYVLALVPPSKPVRVFVVGWAKDSDLPGEPDKGGIFDGAYTIRATALRDMGTFPGGLHGEEAVQEVRGDDHVQDRGQRGLPADAEGREGQLEVAGRD